jgi:hypothetical protein
MVDKRVRKTSLGTGEIQETTIALITYESREKQAKALGISRQALYKRLVNHPEIEEFTSKLNVVAQNTLTLASIKAAERLASLIDSPILKVSMQASIEVLDRAGLTKASSQQQKPEVPVQPILHINPEVKVN